MEKFELGNVVITESISTRMKEDKHFDIFVKCSLGRYKNCDWGSSAPKIRWQPMTLLHPAI